MGDVTRVLLVDDDAALADLTATYLTRIGDSMKTTVETSPESALDRLGSEQIDCVVSDYDMPEKNGLAFFDDVREVEPDLPFILFTGKGSEEIASEAISAGVTDYLQKETGTDQYAVLANRVENAVAKYRAEREAQAADEQRRRLLGRVTDAFLALDDDWRFQYVNDRAAKVFGRDPEDLVGDDIRELFPEGVDEEFHDAYHRAFETQEPVAVESTSSVSPNSWIEARAYPAEDGLSVYGLDVSDRRETETELRRTKEKIEALHDVATRAIACTDEDEIYELAIETAEDILDFDLCTVDVVEGDELVERAVSTGVTVDGTYEAVDLDSDSLPTQVYRSGETSIVHDLHAEGFTPAESDYLSALTVPIGKFGVLQAVSEEPSDFDTADQELTELLAAHLVAALRRVETEVALRAERDRFAALFENVPNAVISCVYEDGQPVVRAVNPAFEDVFGWEADEVVGEPLDEFVVPENKRTEAEAFNERVQQGTHVKGAEVRRRTTDGLRDFLFNTAPVREEPQTEDVSVYTDITEQKERERKLARQNDRLDEFASVVSHDLRNPLNVAQGRADMLTGEFDSDHFEPLVRALDRMDALVADLLALARQERRPTETEILDLGAVAESAWTTAETDDAELRVDCDVTVVADRSRVRQLFENLFRNAVDHTESTVTVRVGSLDAGGFFVEDDGPGIPEAHHDQVFDHGFTTDAAGTGFGLAIVEDVAEAHGWTAAVRTGEIGGARFEIRT